MFLPLGISLKKMDWLVRDRECGNRGKGEGSVDKVLAVQA